MKSAQLIFGAAVLAIAMVGGMRLTAEPATGNTPTFNKDVAAILFNNCVICHRPNQIAPMTLMSYKDVRPWARAIKEKVIKGEMPPWRADGRFGKFRNDRRLAPEQIKTIVDWVDGGRASCKFRHCASGIWAKGWKRRSLAWRADRCWSVT